MPASSGTSTADRLLDAQVAWVIGRLTGPELPDLIADDVDALLALGRSIRLDQLASADDVKAIARMLAETVPPSTAASTLVETAADVVHDGPAEPFTPSELIEREHVEALTDEALLMLDSVEQVLDKLAESPMVAGMAARFMGRIVNDVLSANRAVAEKIPGVGGIVSLGASVAGRAKGVADKQFEALLGDTAGKGATFAMRRLNKVVVDMLRDPSTKAAVLEVFDLYAGEEVPSPASARERDDTRRLAGLLQDVVIGAAASAPALALVDSLIDAFFATYGEHPVTTLVEELDLTRDQLVEHAVAVVPGALRAAHASGELDGIIRERLAAFFASPEVAAILA